MKNMISTQAGSGPAGWPFPGRACMSTGEYTAGWSRPEQIHTLVLNNGFSVRYLRTGSGPPLVLMHTIRTQLDYFEKLIPLLAGYYEIYALDLPGHGQSGILPVEYTEKLFRQTVIDFISQLDLNECTLTGESIGGVLALTVAAELPGRIAHVVSLNPYDYGNRFGGGIRNSRNGWIISLFNVFGAFTIEPRFVLAAALGGGFRDPSALPDKLLTEFYRTGLRPGYRRVEYSVFRNWRSWIEARELYSRISTPVTLAYADDDWSGLHDRERTRQAIGKTGWNTIKNCGHFAALEKPVEVADVILAQRS